MDTTTDRSALERSSSPSCSASPGDGHRGYAALRKAGLIDAIVAKGGNGDRGAPALQDETLDRPGRPTPPTTPPTRGRPRWWSPSGRPRARGRVATTGAQTAARRRRRRSETAAPEATSSGDRQRDRSDLERGRGQGRDERDQGTDRGRDRTTGGERPQGAEQRGERNRRQRPSREERRRMRGGAGSGRAGAGRGAEERLPTLTGILDLLPDGYGFLRTSGTHPGPRTSTSRSRRFARPRCARGTSSPARCAARATTRNTSPCSTSRPSTVWTRSRRLTAELRQAHPALPQQPIPARIGADGTWPNASST